jgi:hypothetical protein
VTHSSASISNLIVSGRSANIYGDLASILFIVVPLSCWLKVTLPAVPTIDDDRFSLAVNVLATFKVTCRESPKGAMHGCLRTLSNVWAN